MSQDESPSPGRVLVVNPSSDVYGSDLQMLESVSALVGRGWAVEVASPDPGPLDARLTAVGAGTHRLAFPVLRRSDMGPRGVASLGLSVMRALPRMVRHLRFWRPDVLYVNTVTIPWWLLAARVARVPVICHVHEAENQDSRAVRAALIMPLRLADRIIVISDAAMTAMLAVEPRLADRAVLVRNGVPAPSAPVLPATTHHPRRLVTLGRLSPRKAPDVALEAVGLLVDRGHDVILDVVGSAFDGYEWYVDELKTRAGAPDLAGRVRFAGYVSPVWNVLAEAEVVLMPSLREPFGNAVVEAQLSQRPVVAADALGHKESIDQGVSGFLVPPGDAVAMADAVERLLADRDLALEVGRAARASALERFSVERYGREVEGVVASLARMLPVSHPGAD